MPRTCIRLEVGLSAWDREIKDRIDLAVFSAAEGTAVPVLIAECKAPEIPLDGKVAAQLRRYLRVLPARWAVATNGRQILSWCSEGGAWESRPLPSWPSMKG